MDADLVVSKSVKEQPYNKYHVVYNDRVYNICRTRMVRVYNFAEEELKSVMHNKELYNFCKVKCI